MVQCTGSLPVTNQANRVLKNVMSDGLSRQISPKKRSLWVINEHFEGEFNALRPGAIVFQHPANGGGAMAAEPVVASGGSRVERRGGVWFNEFVNPQVSVDSPCRFSCPR